MSSSTISSRNSKSIEKPQPESPRLSSSTKSHRRAADPLLPAAYASRVKDHAESSVLTSIYPGENFRTLANFLNRTVRSNEQSSTTLWPTLFATLYQLRVNEIAEALVSEDLRLPTELSPAVKRLSDSHDAVNFFLFLRGHPTRDWLNTVGAQFIVDPEYFRHHLDLNLSPGVSNRFSSPSLPSVSSNFITLRVTTIGLRKNAGQPGNSSIKQARQHANRSMGEFLSNLQRFDSDVGTSFVRRFSVHDHEYYTVEQNISLCCSRNNGSWAVIAWLDSGKDLDKGNTGPWMDHDQQSRLKRLNTVSLLPVIRHYPKIAFNTHRYARSSKASDEARAGFQQSRSVLNQNYGKDLDKAVMARDSFFAVHDLFSFNAFAEVQFLNLVESVLNRETDVAALHEKPSLENLLFHKDLLVSHARALRENIESIKSRGGPDWTRVQPEDNLEHFKTATKHSEVLLNDYTWLLRRTEELSSTCDRGLQDFNNKAIMEETTEANVRSEEMKKLTMIATVFSFVYIPLSVTIGFFGMNFQAFGQGRLPLWLWFAVSVPAVAISALAMMLVIRKWSPVGTTASPPHWRRGRASKTATNPF